MRNFIAEKLRRLRAGESPRVLDLFAGCGGLSLGCQLHGATLVDGIELDPTAASSYAANFHRDNPARHAQGRDLAQTNPVKLLESLRPRAHPRASIDIVVGGPPCQAFARVGRAKLREIMQHPDAFLADPRAQLFRHFLDYVTALAPVGVLIENVPDVLNYGGVNVFDIICRALDSIGYDCRYTLLNAVHFGVPQMRERAFLLAIAKEAAVAPRFPTPTHNWALPRGYMGTKQVALRHLTMFDSFYLTTPPPLPGLPDAVTAFEAMGDLPPITSHLRGELSRAPRRLNSPVALACPPQSAFQLRMRQWAGFESDGCVYDHAIRWLPRDYKIFAKMKAGDQYPEAFATAVRMRDHAAAQAEKRRRKPLTPHEYAALTKEYVPPYDAGKFPNKWRKMESDRPARTLMAHIGKDSYSHIHYDSSQARTISVREAARLQSFPDGYRLSGTMNPAFRQIGNAVPPLLAGAVFGSLIQVLQSGRLNAEPFEVRERALG